MASRNYRDFVQDLAVTWLSGTWGERVLYAAAEVLDAIIDANEEAAKVRFIDTAPSDSLKHHGDDSNLPRYSPDTTATYRARLQQRFDTWRTAGTRRGWEVDELGNEKVRGLTGQLNAFGFPNVTIYANNNGVDGNGDENFNNPWPHDSSDWSRFWVILDKPHQYTWPTWGVMVWGAFVWGVVDANGDVIDLGGPLQKLVRKWKPAHERCVEIIVLGDTDTPIWGHNMTWGDFTWGAGSNGMGAARFPG